MKYTVNVNGVDRTVDVDPSTPLLWVLRDDLKLTGTKYGCGKSQCGACTVHVDGEARRTCMMPIRTVGTRKVVTIEQLDGPLAAALKQAWIDQQVPQCGYCQSGQLMSAAALLADTPSPTDAQIDEALKRNACRCATYNRIRRAIHQTAQSLEG